MIRERRGVFYDSIQVKFPSLTSRRTTSGGMYVLSLLVDDTMSRPSNINSSVSRLDRGKKHVILGAAAAALLSSSLSSSSSLSGAGVGVGGGVQWLFRRTARPVLSDSLNASRVLRRRIYNRVKHTVFTCSVAHRVPA